MKNRIVYLIGLAALVAFGSFLVACGDDDDDGGGSEADRQEIADLVQTIATTNGSEATQEEVDFYFAHITDGFVQDFGTESVEACQENAEECIGEPLSSAAVSPDDVEVDGDSATAVIQSDEGAFGVNLIKEEDTWKADGLFVPDDDIPEGTETIELTMTEFAFEADFESDAVKSGDFAFHAVNEGEQVHEAVMVALPEEGTIEEILDDPSFEPQPIFVKFPYGPGEESDIAIPEPLEPGRYGLVCFLPDTDDPEGTPHAFKGMTAEFTVE